MKNKKIKCVMQMRQTECGLCVAQMMLNYYGVMVDISDINSIAEVGRNGMSFMKMKELFSYYKVDASLYRLNLSELSKIKKLTPFIAFQKENHFVLIEKIVRNKIYVIDPAAGKRCIKLSEYLKEFTDKIICIRPGEGFEHIKRKKKKSIIINSLFICKQNFFKVLSMSLIVYIAIFTIPMLSQNLLNYLLTSGVDKEHLLPWSELIVVILASYFGLLWLKANVDINLSIKLDKYLTTSVIDKLLSNDIRFFQQRSSADIQYRFSLLRAAKILLNGIVVSAFLDVGSMVVIICYVAINAPKYLLILMAATILILGMKIFLKDRIILYKNEETAADSKVQNIQNDMFRTIADVKVLGIQKEKKQRWLVNYTNYINKHQKYERLMARYRSVISSLNLFIPIFIIIVGAWQIYKTNNISEIAVIVSLQGVMGIYLSSLISISNMLDNMYLINAYMSRIDDIMNQNDENNGRKNIEFKGNIKVKNLYFRYPGEENYALEDINIEIKEGKKIAFTGCTGSGKSTLLNILVGLHREYDGEIYFEGKNIMDINDESIRSEISVVPQNTLLFNGTLRENIDITGEMTDEEIYEALDIVDLGDYVKGLPMNLNTIIAENGFNFSGGQRQRIAIARAIANKGNVICLDEATSSLDNKTEKKIVNYFKDNNSTQIIVAHRLSTIVDADYIYVLKDGKIVEEGNHTQLLKRGGEYTSLYQNEVNNEKNISCAG